MSRRIDRVTRGRGTFESGCFSFFAIMTLIELCREYSAEDRCREHLDEMAFRFNRRKATDRFEDTLRHMVNTDPLTFRALVA